MRYRCAKSSAAAKNKLIRKTSISDPKPYRGSLILVGQTEKLFLDAPLGARQHSANEPGVFAHGESVGIELWADRFT